MSYGEYQSAAYAVRERHILRDAELVAPSAEHHSVNISVGRFFDGAVHGAYNIRLPQGDQHEEGRLASVRGVAKLCIDFRQSAQVIGMVEKTGYVAWAYAGGAAQPNESILNTDIELWDAMFSLNQNLIPVLLAHLGVCGGANHYSDGKVKKLNETTMVGPTLEASYIKNQINRYEAQLRKLQSKIDVKKGVVHLGTNNRFKEVAWFR